MRNSTVHVDLPRGLIWLDDAVVGHIGLSSSGATEISMNVDSDRLFEVLQQVAATGALKPSAT